MCIFCKSVVKTCLEMCSKNIVLLVDLQFLNQIFLLKLLVSRMLLLGCICLYKPRETLFSIFLSVFAKKVMIKILLLLPQLKHCVNIE